MRSFQGFCCLMQISTREEDYLVEVLELRKHMHVLNSSFTNPRILKARLRPVGVARADGAATGAARRGHGHCVAAARLWPVHRQHVRHGPGCPRALCASLALRALSSVLLLWLTAVGDAAYPQFGLAFLLKRFCNITADKKYQLADWRVRYRPYPLALPALPG
jgi:exosome complex exonuclease RRP6